MFYSQMRTVRLRELWKHDCCSNNETIDARMYAIRSRLTIYILFFLILHLSLAIYTTKTTAVIKLNERRKKTASCVSAVGKLVDCHHTIENHKNSQNTETTYRIDSIWSNNNENGISSTFLRLSRTLSTSLPHQRGRTTRRRRQQSR